MTVESSGVGVVTVVGDGVVVSAVVVVVVVVVVVLASLLDFSVVSFVDSFSNKFG